MTTTINSVTAEPANHRNSIAVTTTLTPVAWRLTRTIGDVAETVRGDDPTNGAQFAASGTTRTLFDVEVPRDLAATYVVTAVEADGDTESSSASSPVTLEGGVEFWWAHPLSLPRLHTEFYMASQSDQTRAMSRGVFRGIGSTYPIVTVGARQAPGPGTLQAITYDFAEAETLTDNLGLSEVIVVRAPANEGWGRQGRRYVSLGDISQRRAANVPDSPYVVDLPWIEVASPTDPITGFGATWQDVIDNYATWQDVINAFPTWDALLSWVPA